MYLQLEHVPDEGPSIQDGQSTLSQKHDTGDVTEDDSSFDGDTSAHSLLREYNRRLSDPSATESSSVMPCVDENPAHVSFEESESDSSAAISPQASFEKLDQEIDRAMDHYRLSKRRDRSDMRRRRRQDDSKAQEVRLILDGCTNTGHKRNSPERTNARGKLQDVLSLLQRRENASAPLDLCIREGDAPSESTLDYDDPSRTKPTEQTIESRTKFVDAAHVENAETTLCSNDEAQSPEMSSAKEECDRPRVVEISLEEFSDMESCEEHSMEEVSVHDSLDEEILDDDHFSFPSMSEERILAHSVVFDALDDIIEGSESENDSSLYLEPGDEAINQPLCLFSDEDDSVELDLLEKSVDAIKEVSGCENEQPPAPDVSSPSVSDGDSHLTSTNQEVRVELADEAIELSFCQSHDEQGEDENPETVQDECLSNEERAPDLSEEVVEPFESGDRRPALVEAVSCSNAFDVGAKEDDGQGFELSLCRSDDEPEEGRREETSTLQGESDEMQAVNDVSGVHAETSVETTSNVALNMDLVDEGVELSFCQSQDQSDDDDTQAMTQSQCFSDDAKAVDQVTDTEDREPQTLVEEGLADATADETLCSSTQTSYVTADATPAVSALMTSTNSVNDVSDEVSGVEVFLMPTAISDDLGEGSQRGDDLDKLSSLSSFDTVEAPELVGEASGLEEDNVDTNQAVSRGSLLPESSVSAEEKLCKRIVTASGEAPLSSLDNPKECPVQADCLEESSTDNASTPLEQQKPAECDCAVEGNSTEVNSFWGVPWKWNVNVWKSTKKPCECATQVAERDAPIPTERIEIASFHAEDLSVIDKSNTDLADSDSGSPSFVSLDEAPDLQLDHGLQSSVTSAANEAVNEMCRETAERSHDMHDAIVLSETAGHQPDVGVLSQTPLTTDNAVCDTNVDVTESSSDHHCLAGLGNTTGHEASTEEMLQIGASSPELDSDTVPPPLPVEGLEAVTVPAPETIADASEFVFVRGEAADEAKASHSTVFPATANTAGDDCQPEPQGQVESDDYWAERPVHKTAVDEYWQERTHDVTSLDLYWQESTCNSPIEHSEDRRGEVVADTNECDIVAPTAVETRKGSEDNAAASGSVASVLMSNVDDEIHVHEDDTECREENPGAPMVSTVEACVAEDEHSGDTLREAVSKALPQEDNAECNEVTVDSPSNVHTKIDGDSCATQQIIEETLTKTQHDPSLSTSDGAKESSAIVADSSSHQDDVVKKVTYQLKIETESGELISIGKNEDDKRKSRFQRDSRGNVILSSMLMLSRGARSSTSGDVPSGDQDVQRKSHGSVSVSTADTEASTVMESIDGTNKDDGSLSHCEATGTETEGRYVLLLDASDADLISAIDFDEPSSELLEDQQEDEEEEVEIEPVVDFRQYRRVVEEEAGPKMKDHHSLIYPKSIPSSEGTHSCVSLSFLSPNVPFEVSSKVFDEALRILKPGGAIYIIDIGGKTVENNPRMSEIVSRAVGPGVRSKILEIEMQEILISNGFKMDGPIQDNPEVVRWRGYKPL